MKKNKPNVKLGVCILAATILMAALLDSGADLIPTILIVTAAITSLFIAMCNVCRNPTADDTDHNHSSASRRKAKFTFEELYDIQNDDETQELFRQMQMNQMQMEQHDQMQNEQYNQMNSDFAMKESELTVTPFSQGGYDTSFDNFNDFGF